LLDNLSNVRQGISLSLKPVLDQVLRVGRTYRSGSQRDDNPDGVFHRVIMLQKLKTGILSARSLTDFVLLNETPDQIAALISDQILRVPLLESFF
jgi:hypothetical protein